MSYLKSGISGIAYPMNTVSDPMRYWMDQVKESKSQVGQISHPDRNKELIDECRNFQMGTKFKVIFNNNSKFGLEAPIGKIFYMDFVYDDGQAHLKSNRKRITLQFNWMEEVNYGTCID